MENPEQRVPITAAGAETIARQKKEEIVRRYGPWTVANLRLGDGLFTRHDAGDQSEDPMLRRLVQLVKDLGPRPIQELRILDLACLEGLYAIEFALQGATVVAVEVREANIEKARFTAATLGLDRLSFVQDDVRNVTRAAYGSFDVVLCTGILYHLDAPDVFAFIENIAAMSNHYAIFDTHVSLRPVVRRVYRGRSYRGRNYIEHEPGSTPAEKAARPWASIDNDKSFWFTRPSLINCLADAGFTSVLDCCTPANASHFRDRVTLLACRGSQEPLGYAPAATPAYLSALPERDRRRPHRSQRWLR